MKTGIEVKGVFVSIISGDLEPHFVFPDGQLKLGKLVATCPRRKEAPRNTVARARLTSRARKP